VDLHKPGAIRYAIGELLTFALQIRTLRHVLMSHDVQISFTPGSMSSSITTILIEKSWA
jgi:hypothetical protein